MNLDQINQELYYEWADPKGFFWQLRDGVFSEIAFERVKKILESVDHSEVESWDKRFVHLTWAIPIFMEWQNERVKNTKNNDFRAYLNATSWAYERIDKIFESPF